LRFKKRSELHLDNGYIHPQRITETKLLHSFFLSRRKDDSCFNRAAATAAASATSIVAAGAVAVTGLTHSTSVVFVAHYDFKV
jgi:hypothetical protein